MHSREEYETTNEHSDTRRHPPCGWADGSDEHRLPARKKRLVMYCVSLLLDCTALLLGYSLAIQLREQDVAGTGRIADYRIALPVFLMCEIAQEAQSVESLTSRSLATQRALSALLMTALLVLALSFLIKEQSLSRVGYLVSFLGAAGFILVGKVIENFIFARWMGGSATTRLLLLDGLSVDPLEGCDCIDVEAEGLWPDLAHPVMIDALAQIVEPYDRVIVACRFERRGEWATFLRVRTSVARYCSTGICSTARSQWEIMVLKIPSCCPGGP